MTRLIVIALVLSVLCRWIFGRWPWDFLKAKPTTGQAVFRARKLLGVSSHATHAQIIEAHKRLVRQVHPAYHCALPHVPEPSPLIVPAGHVL